MILFYLLFLLSIHSITSIPRKRFFFFFFFSIPNLFLNNFFPLLSLPSLSTQLFSVFCDSTVQQIIKTNNCPPLSSRATFEKFRKILGGGDVYKKGAEGMVPPCVPWLGYHLRTLKVFDLFIDHLTFVLFCFILFCFVMLCSSFKSLFIFCWLIIFFFFQVETREMSDTVGDLINFEKWMKIYLHIQELQRFQQLRYEIILKKGILSFPFLFSLPPFLILSPSQNPWKKQWKPALSPIETLSTNGYPLWPNTKKMKIL